MDGLKRGIVVSRFSTSIVFICFRLRSKNPKSYIHFRSKMRYYGLRGTLVECGVFETIHECVQRWRCDDTVVFQKFHTAEAAFAFAFPRQFLRVESQLIPVLVDDNSDDNLVLAVQKKKKNNEKKAINNKRQTKTKTKTRVWL